MKSTIDLVPQGAGYPLLLTWHGPTRHLGLEGTELNVVAWVLELPGPARPDPVLKVGRVDEAELERLLEELKATGLTEDEGERGLKENFWYRLGPRSVALAVGPQCRWSPGRNSRGWRCPGHAVKALLEELTLKTAVSVVEVPPTELYIPVPPAGAVPSPIECADVRFGVCYSHKLKGKLECYPTPKAGEHFCVAAPWAQAGLLGRPQGGPPPALYDSELYGARLENGTSCAISERHTMDCEDEGTLGAPVPGQQRWFAPRLTQVARSQGAPGLPLFLARVHPRGAYLRRGEKLELPTGGPFEIQTSSSEWRSGSTFTTTISGDERGATVTSVTTRGSRSARPRTDRKKGRLDAAAVAALWEKLDAVPWPAIESVESRIPDITGTTIYIRRGAFETRRRYFPCEDDDPCLIRDADQAIDAAIAQALGSK